MNNKMILNRSLLTIKKDKFAFVLYFGDVVAREIIKLKSAKGNKTLLIMRKTIVAKEKRKNLHKTHNWR
jgi:hypothetical protein